MLKMAFQAEKVLPNACISKYPVPFFDNVRLKALTLGYVLNTHIMGIESLENFLRTHKGRGVTFFRLGPLSQKVNFGGQ